MTLYRNHKAPMEMLITDVVAPGMSGPMLADKLTAIQPDLKVLYISGYDNTHVVQKYVVEKGHALLLSHSQWRSCARGWRPCSIPPCVPTREFRAAPEPVVPSRLGDHPASSDSSLLVSFGDRISPEAHLQVLRLTRRLEGSRAVRNLHPAFSLGAGGVRSTVYPGRGNRRSDPGHAGSGSQGRCRHAPARQVEIPVRYGGEFGPDLEDVARHAGIAAGRVVELHASAEYEVYFLGFATFFVYLGGLPAEIATPRLSAPRRQVPAGSVGIAGNQAGIYPMASPGGWRIIGRTGLRLFDPKPSRRRSCAWATGCVSCRWRRIGRERHSRPFAGVPEHRAGSGAIRLRPVRRFGQRRGGRPGAARGQPAGGQCGKCRRDRNDAGRRRFRV